MNPIEEFYNDSVVLISGGTGFLGSVLIEKLLRCFDVKKIYVMIRIKNGESVKERLENVLNKEVGIKVLWWIQYFIFFIRFFKSCETQILEFLRKLNPLKLILAVTI